MFAWRRKSPLIPWKMKSRECILSVLALWKKKKKELGTRGRWITHERSFAQWSEMYTLLGMPKSITISKKYRSSLSPSSIHFLYCFPRRSLQVGHTAKLCLEAFDSEAWSVCVGGGGRFPRCPFLPWGNIWLYELRPLLSPGTRPATAAGCRIFLFSQLSHLYFPPSCSAVISSRSWRPFEGGKPLSTTTPSPNTQPS